MREANSMAQANISAKRIAIDKAYAQTVAFVAIASFVAVFSLVASKAVWSQTRYQARVTTVKEKAHQQLKKNIQAFETLSGSYKNFDSEPTNVLGGASD